MKVKNGHEKEGEIFFSRCTVIYLKIVDLAEVLSRPEIRQYRKSNQTANAKCKSPPPLLSKGRNKQHFSVEVLPSQEIAISVMTNRTNSTGSVRQTVTK